MAGHRGGTKGARTRQVLLGAAIARFGRDGYRATSVADIAREAGLGGTVPYAYFAGKEALFFAAVDEDAAAVIEEAATAGLERFLEPGWYDRLMATLLQALDRHPLARRLLAGLEPEVTERVLDIPALGELRKGIAERLAAGQLQGSVRGGLDPLTAANGMVALTLSLLMSVIQVGPRAVALFGTDVTSVLDAALQTGSPPPRLKRC